MSLHLNTGLGHHAGHHHLHAARQAAQKVNIDPRSQIHEAENDSSFGDVVARQLSGAQGFKPVAAKRAKAVPFGKRSIDDYEGPIQLEQDEFAPKATRVRRQQASPTPGLPSGDAMWMNGDIGRVQAVYPNGTITNIVVADVVYATEGSEDGSAEGAVPLQAQIITPDGQEISETTLFALSDYLALYASENDPKPWIGFEQSENPGVPYWMAPVSTVADVWSIDTETGLLTPYYQNTKLQLATNLNTVFYPGTQFSGNGDTDAFPENTPVPADHAALSLQLVKI